MTEKIELKVKHVPPETLKPYFRNTKKHSEEQLRKMAKLLDKYHFDQPIVVTPELVIIKGHGRYMAALLSQTKRLVPIVIRDDLTEAQMNAARISDNRIFELGEAIPELIKSEVADFVTQGDASDHAFAASFFDFLPQQVVEDKSAAPVVKEAKPWEKKHTDISDTLAAPAGQDHQAEATTVAEQIAEQQAQEEVGLTAPATVPDNTPAATKQSIEAQISAEAAKLTQKKPKPKAELRCPHCGEIHEE